MIWQAFAVVDVRPGVAIKVPLQRGEDKGPMRIPIRSRLRRVAWVVEGAPRARNRTPAIATGSLHASGRNYVSDVVSVALVGSDRSVSWLPPLDLMVLEPGETVVWQVDPGTAEGIYVFTFDFETA